MATAQDVFAFRAQYAELCLPTTTNPDIAAALNTADMFVDPSGDWSTPEEVVRARLLLAAHLLALTRWQGAMVKYLGAGMMNLYIGGITIGERTVSIGQHAFLSGVKGGSVDEMMYDLTIYGHLYKKLLKRNFPPIMVI